MRVLALDVPRVLDEDTLIRPKPLKADLGEYVNAEVVEGERCCSKPVDALHNMQAMNDLEEEGSRAPLSCRLARYPAEEHSGRPR